MEARTSKCQWCGKTYAIKDSSASYRSRYCSEDCESEWTSANEEYSAIVDLGDGELTRAWESYVAEYNPSADEEDPAFAGICRQGYVNKQEFLAFKRRYNKWKRNHCWKKDFWDWDPASDDSCDDSEGGWGAAAGGLVVLCGAAWLIWKIIKTVWNWLF